MENLHIYQDYVADALTSVEFKLIRSRNDVNDSRTSFSPIMAHQIFGEHENIFGFKDLKIKIMYTAGPMNIYFDSEYSSRIENNEIFKCDDIAEAISSKLPDGCYYTNLDEFLKSLNKNENFRPFGEKLEELQIKDNEDQNRHFEIYYCDHQNSKFQSYFNRFQTLVLWFIDAASYIDIDDPQWCYFICYEKYKNENGNYEYASVGYTTVYQYYAWPENIRPRISQMLVLPPFQKLGIGTKFIKVIYKYFHRENVIDITVENPSEEFQRLRNYVDANLCRNLSSFSNESIKKGFNELMVKEAKETYKINSLQCRKVYEILRLLHTNEANINEIKCYRLDVKKRLNRHYHKQMRDIKKIEKAGLDTQWMTAVIPTINERLQQLNAEYNDVVEEYRRIVDKLKE